MSVAVAIPEVDWSQAERRAWRPPERLKPSEWAEKFRRLTRRQSARPGKWQNEQAPYLTGIMDLCVRRDVEQITVMKAAQVGVSEAVRNVIGFFAHTEPDPVLLVLPSEETGRKITGKRIIPLLQDTACLKELFTERAHDIQLRQIVLSNGFTLSLGWSGSPSTLASDPQRVVVNDEVDKFTEWSGRESDPIKLAYMRTQTYESRRKIINISTPTTRDGKIFDLFETSEIKLYYWVPCPHCGQYQRLTFDRLKWEKFEGLPAATRAALIEANQAAWYECEHCDEKITDRHKVEIVNRGVWAVEEVGERLTELAEAAGPGGIVTEGWPAGKRVGLHLSALYCLWIHFPEIAAEFVRSQGDPAALMNFRNSWLGELFERKIASSTEEAFAAKCGPGAPPARVVPQWATMLLSTADVQKGHFYYVVRAWGHNDRSRRITHGICETFEELREICLDTRYPIEGGTGQAPMSPRLLGIDSGYDTANVYRFALTDSTRIKPMKGEAEPKAMPVRSRRITYTPPGKSKSARMQVFLHLIDTQYFKDILAGRIGGTVERVNLETGELTGESDAWLLNSENDPDYNRQLASEHKIIIRSGRGTPIERWEKVTSGAANHYLDCEVYQFALAHMFMAELARGGQPKKTWSQRRVNHSAGRSKW